jgi:hypothetical protein
MPRPESTHYELTETEKRDLIKLIETGRPLPERYRFLLFEDKREVELIWNSTSAIFLAAPTAAAFLWPPEFRWWQFRF